MFMYLFRILSAHTSHMCTVQFALPFPSGSSGQEFWPCGYGFGQQQSIKELNRAVILTSNLCYSQFLRDKGSIKLGGCKRRLNIFSSLHCIHRTKHCRHGLWAFPRFQLSIKLLLSLSLSRLMCLSL